MSSVLKFIWGDGKLLKTRKITTEENHAPIRVERGKGCAGDCKFCKNKCPRGFSIRTNRDRNQSVGRLYLGD